jgi:hypothetical protein
MDAGSSKKKKKSSGEKRKKSSKEGKVFFQMVYILNKAIFLFALMIINRKRKTNERKILTPLNVPSVRTLFG